MPQITRHGCGVVDVLDCDSVCDATCFERDYVPPENLISSRSCQVIDSKRSTM